MKGANNMFLGKIECIIVLTLLFLIALALFEWFIKRIKKENIKK